MIIDFCLYFLVVSLSIIWFYSAGFYSLKIIKVHFSDKETNTLVCLLVGLIIHVVFFSIYKTHFGTFNTLLLIVLFFIWLEYRKEKQIQLPSVSFKIHLKKITELLVFALFFLLLKFFSSVDSTIYPFFLGGRDDIFYSQVSSFISKHGVESCYLDWTSQISSLGMVPYHYFELWLNSLIADTTGFVNLSAYYFITSVLIIIVLYQTILMIASNLLHVPLTYKHKVLSFSLIYFGDLFFGLISNHTWPNLSFGLALYNNYKVILVFIVFVLSWLKWKDCQYSISFLLLLIVPLLNYGLMPVIICTTPLFFVLHRWIFKMPEKIPYSRILLLYALFTILISGIQKVFSNKFEGVTMLGFNEVISYYDEFSKFKTLLNYILNYAVKIVLLVLPFIIIIFPLKKCNLLLWKNGFVLLMSMFLLSALVLSSILYFVAETSQIFTITLNSIVHLLLYSAIFLLFFKVEKHFFYKGLIGIYLLSGLFILAYSLEHKGSIMNRYSAKFLNEVMSVSANINGQGIRYLTPDYYKSAYDFDPNCNFEGYYLSFLKNNVIIHTVTVNQIPDKKELHDFFNYNKKLALKASYYLYFINKERLSSLNDEMAQLYFIKNNNIDFIIATKNAVIPRSVKRLVTKEITDTLSGEKLMLIDRKRY